MVDWLESCIEWFVANKDEIILFFTSTNFVTFISAVILIVKQINVTKSSNNTVNSMSDTLNTANKIAGKVADVNNLTQQITVNTEQLQTRMEDLDERLTTTLDLVQQKFNAMLEVQSIVYASIKDDVVRKNVNNILTSAKLLETEAKAKLEVERQKIEEIKKAAITAVEQKVEELTDVKEPIETAVAKVKKVVTPKKSEVQRY